MSFKQYTALDIPTIATIRRIKKPYTAVSLFAGCGGASLGLRLSGFRMLYASEWSPTSAAIYKANSEGSTILDGRDVREIQPKEILKQIGLKRGQLDYLDASPPCSLFSRAGLLPAAAGAYNRERLQKNGETQTVDDLFPQAIRILDGLLPRVCVMENVVGITSRKFSGYLLEAIRGIEAVGYRVKVGIIDASRLGVPQARRRAIIVCVRKDLKVDPIFPEPYSRGSLTVREAFPNINAVWVTNPKGSLWRSPDAPGPTIIASDFSKKNIEFTFSSGGGFYRDVKGHVHKYTLTELLKYFGFPADFCFDATYEKNNKVRKVSKGDAWYAVGMSHVPLSVYNIASTIREQILERVK